MTALATFTPEEEERHERATGFAECPDCGEEVQPCEGDPDGLCWHCLIGEVRT